MRKTLVITGALIVLAVIVWQITSSWVPRFSTYEDQKKYAFDLTKKADEAEQVMVFMPVKWVMYFVRDVIYRPAMRKALKADLYIVKKYPQIALNDVDVLGRLGYEYQSLEKYNKAIEMYQRQLMVFKNKYLNKKYPEKEGLTALQAKTEEYRYVVKVHRKIAACYNAMKQYEKGLKEYEKILQLLPEIQAIDKWEREEIFKDTFITIGKMYKALFKDYEKAIKAYEQMKTEFSTSPFHISMADIYIGDTYLAMGDVSKAKGTYQAVVDRYKYPGSLANYSVAEERLREIDRGQVIATDDLYYEIKDGTVTTRLIGSKKIMSVSEIK